MFMAYASAARSAQAGRQVGAAITTPEGDVVAVGFNEVPTALGGPYWDGDVNDGRDHAYGDKTDSNYLHRSRIVNSIYDNLAGMLLTRENTYKLLKGLDPGASEDRLKAICDLIVTEPTVKKAIHSSELKDITEYGRAVHAEMDALLTIFPCHNCTRHIIAAGLSRVTYIE